MSIRFVFVTDSHHYPDAPKDYGPPKMLTHSRTIMDKAVLSINAVAPDFIVHGGDLLCGGNAFELPWSAYVRSVEEAAHTFGQLKAPVYYVPGNHDCDAQQGSFELFARHFPIPDTLRVFDPAPRVRLATANVYQCDPIVDSHGVWTKDLDQALRHAARTAYDQGCALILALHTWILPHDDERNQPTATGVVVHADRLIDTIATHPAIVMVLTGHRHRNRIRAVHGCLIFDTACLVGFPMGFREITIQDDGAVLARFHRLDLPELIQASFLRSSLKENQEWEGTPGDRDMDMALSRLQTLWKRF
jgi:predicted phosphodiesterase